MAFDITAEHECTVVAGGHEIGCIYREPTSEERVAYKAAQMGKRGRFDPRRIYEAQVRFGLKILARIREGDITVNGAPLVCDDAGAWKRVIRDGCPQVAEAVARRAFEGAALDDAALDDAGDDASGDDDAGGSGEGEEETRPL